MSFKIIRNDITKVSCDAIVNTANPMPVIGRGTDSAIYTAAGRDELLSARKQIGIIERGKSAWTEAFNLKSNGIRYIIHTVGVSYCDGKNGETDILRNCYSSSLNMAKELGCKSVAIPLLATGFYSFPKEIGLQIAIDEISRFLIENEIDVTLVVYDRKSYLISEKLFDDIQSFIDDNFSVHEKHSLCDDMFAVESSCMGELFEEHREETLRRSKKRNETEIQLSKSCDINSDNDASVHGIAVTGVRPLKKTNRKKISPIDVDAFITQSKTNLNFQNTLQQLIADRKLENSAVYTKALIDRKFFSKIISNKDYVPKKMTVMALGLALGLKLDEYENFLASAGYAFMPSSKFDLIIKYCVINEIYNLVEVDMILDSHGECCFAPD
ncbi:MAG: macro domain-containing protein [Treponema sp.]|nr:macro domain-containing protein [Treponema sp.]